MKAFLLEKRKSFRPKISGTVFIFIVLMLSSCSMFFFVPETVLAVSAITTKQNQLDAILQKKQAYEDMRVLKEKQQAMLGTQIQGLQSQTQKLQSDITANENRLATLDDQIRILEGKISEKSDLVIQQKKILVALFRSYYAQRNDMDPSAGTFVFASVADAQELNRQNDWTSDTGARVLELTQSVETLRKTLVTEQDALRSNRDEAQTIHLQLDQQHAYLDSATQNKQAMAEQAQAAAQQYTKIISDLEQQRQEIEQEIQALDAAKVQQLDLSTLPGFGTALFIYPVKDPHESQGYGKVGTTFAKASYSGGFHNGVDYADVVGTPIYAAAAGTVIGVGQCGDKAQYAYGKWVAIDHGNGLVTLYGHMSKQVAYVGQVVAQGQQIGLMGATGFATGPHVHFAVFAKSSFEVVESKSVPGTMIPTGATVSPKSYLPKQ